MKFRHRFFFLSLFVFTIGNYATAQQKEADSLQLLIQAASSDTQRINLQLKLVNIFRSSKPDEGEKIAAVALTKSRETKYKKGEGFALNALGTIQDARGNYDSALILYQQSLAVFESADIEEGKAAALLSIGNYYYYQSDFIKGADYMLQSLRLYEKLNDKAGLASALNNLGSLYNDKKDYRKALEYYNRALVIKKELNQPRSLATTLLNLGNVYYDLKIMDSALLWYQQSLDNATQYGNKRLIASARSNIGNIFFDKKQYKEALVEYEAALEIDKERGNQEGIGISNINAGHAYLMLKQYDVSIPMLKEGLQMLQEVGNKFQEQSALKYLAEAYVAKGEHATAYNYLKKYVAVHDSVYTEESNQRVAEMQTLYETEKKDKEIIILSKEKQVQRRTNIFLIALAALIFLLGLILWSRYRFKQKTNRLLAEKNDELIRLNATKDKLFAIVAHDLKNPLSAFRSITQNLNDNKLQISKEEIEYFVGRMNQSANQLYDLLQNLLNWAISQIGKLPFAPEKFSLADVANNNAALFQNNTLQKKQQIKINVPEQLQVMADKNMIQTVVRNLFSNAVRFTPENGTIELSAQKENGEMIFSIADTGPGIAAEDIKKLFRIEEDVTKVGSSPEKGTGLGLILCKELIEKNKGRIWVESSAGQGSRFSFALPADGI